MEMMAMATMAMVPQIKTPPKVNAGVRVGVHGDGCSGWNRLDLSLCSEGDCGRGAYGETTSHSYGDCLVQRNFIHLN